tara:strand:- start:3711 stop:4715 length:1005 start_codon:yes stop_codon:yes gene_type:complete
MGKTFGSGDSTTQKKASSSTDSTKLPLTGGTLTGDVTIDATTPTLTLGKDGEGGTTTDSQIQFLSSTRDYHITSDNDERTLLIGEWNGSDPTVDVGIKVSEDGALQLNKDIIVGTGAAEDTRIVFDGNAKDFYVGIDDGTDTLMVGVGATVGSNQILTLTDDSVTFGDGAEVDLTFTFDGNAHDFKFKLMDSADEFALLLDNIAKLGLKSDVTVSLSAGNATQNPGVVYFPNYITWNTDAALTVTLSQSGSTIVMTNASGVVILPDFGTDYYGTQYVVVNATTSSNSGAVRRTGINNKFYHASATSGETSNQTIDAMKAKTFIYIAENKWLVVG